MKDSIAELKAEVDRLTAEVDAWRGRAEAAEGLSERDVLTPCLNRRGFVERVEAAMALARRHGTGASLLYIDLDGFKGVNDRLGHPAGDAALIRTAEILSRGLRASDSVGRLGGDEFAVLLVGTDIEGGRAKAGALVDALRTQGFDWQGVTRPLRASIGVRDWSGQDEAETWLAEADASMWVMKPKR